MFYKTKYNAESGKIIGVYGRTREAPMVPIESDENLYDGNYLPDKFYFLDGLPVLRQENKTTISTTNVPADGETAVILQAVAGTLTVGRERYEVEAGEIELTFDTPGEYRIRLDAFPYLPFEAVIHAY